MPGQCGFAASDRCSRTERDERLLDFWTRTRKSGNPKVVTVFSADFVRNYRETKAQTRRDRRRKERLLDHFDGAPRAVRRSKSPQRTLACDAPASSSRPRPTNATICRPKRRTHPNGENNLEIVPPKTQLASEFAPRQRQATTAVPRRRFCPRRPTTIGQHGRHGDSSAACPLAGGPRPPSRPAEQDCQPPTTAPGPRGGPATGNGPHLPLTPFTTAREMLSRP